ncbi:hypothetical protein Q4Q35_05245 [Flavivirga aquimarina]|uniref:Uncharacterized protein n=1 Tax=Flavivirga aquimarina TaxID=2027862 RepID=A0ABT8W822_9FLAO|nr:hypothetical protein [Flavivirga aquimarina]MDO5969207.1 hypothetical protein [Flavivirga aquimarina]
MKTKLIFTLLALTILFNCSKSDDNQDDVFEGSIEDIIAFYNEDLIDALEDLGFDINTGNAPPNLEGTFLFSPLILEASTVSGDIPGHLFSDYLATFSNQNNETLTIDYIGNHVNFSQKDEGNGAFISGSNNEFSMFLKTSSQINDSVLASATIAISGKVTEDGLEDMQMAIMMLDNKGNPDGVYIPDNTGRLLYDSDFISPKQ